MCLGSALHSFGSSSKGNSSLKIPSLKRSKRQKISVQPEAIKRRKISSGSRQKQSKGNSRQGGMAIPSKIMITGKRKHSFAKNVQNNQKMAKKSGRSMKSKTRNPVKEKTSVVVAKTEG